jgi:hypothetical protein
MLAKLPYFRDAPLPVEVQIWIRDPFEDRDIIKQVYLRQGLLKDALSETHLKGAVFFPENVRVEARQSEN